jgi:hypothetical protein
MALLADDRLDALISEDIPFAQAPERLPAILDPSWRGLTAAICY